MGAVHEGGISNWDLSYNGYLRGPVLLISEIIPNMIKSSNINKDKTIDVRNSAVEDRKEVFYLRAT